MYRVRMYLRHGGQRDVDGVRAFAEASVRGGNGHGEGEERDDESVSQVGKVHQVDDVGTGGLFRDTSAGGTDPRADAGRRWRERCDGSRKGQDGWGEGCIRDG